MPAQSSSTHALDQQQTESSPRRRAAFALLVLVVLCLFSAPLFVDLVDRRAPPAKSGVVDLGGVRPFDAPIQLDGEWMLEWHGSGYNGYDPAKSVPVAVPGSWAGEPGPDGALLPESGIASYRLLIRGIPPGTYLLHLPQIYAATRVWIDGSPVSAMGRLGRTPETTTYRVRAHHIPFTTSGNEVELRIDIAAFHHRDNGIEGVPTMGPASAMSGWTSLKWAQNLLFPTSLFLIAVYGLVVFLFRRNDRASLYLALSFLSAVPIALIFSHDNLLSIALPDLGFPYIVTLQYVCGIFSVAFFAAYVDALFPQESNRPVFWAILATFGSLLAAQTYLLAQGNTLSASRLSQLAEPVRMLTFLYLIGVAAVAALRRREGAIIFLVGISVFLVMISLRALVTNGFLPQSQATGVDFTPVGMLVFLFSQVIILAERWSSAIQISERTTEDLRRLLDVNSSITSEIRLEELLRKIVRVTSKIVQADRSSLFLHDAKTDELWSVVAEGIDEKKLRFKSTLGLAGHSFASGEIINVGNAYEDPRFNRSIDVETGYKTGSILTLPVVARDGRRLGVMQALNRRRSGVFDDDDVARMQAFGAQAAIAIDNATLFAEVTAARNYNESILRSMSSGVITIDPDSNLAKLNRAACSILRVTGDQLQKLDAKEALTARNPWLEAELDEVARDGASKSLIDVDFNTPRGEQISVNLSIVPLVLDGGSVGILILIEDISEGKRLQGAMRRFMTQEVVDQVLGRNDELLFGSSCTASVLFADIRNFTSMAERLSPRETVDMLNEIFTELFEAVASSGGMLDKFIGDAIMAVYGAPLSTGRDPDNAVQSALQMFQMLDGLNAARELKGSARLRLGIGVASGDVVAGTIGSPKRMDYTVIGDSVNLASRLQDLTKHYGVGLIVCETTAATVRNWVVMRELDLIRVRGRTRPAKIFEVAASAGEAGHARLRSFGAYQRGRDHLSRRAWSKAVAAFEEAHSVEPHDAPAALMLERARSLLRKPPPVDWDGVWTSPS